MKQNEIVFKCKKCEHNLYIPGPLSLKKIKKVSELECPGCGEDGNEIWILSRLGNFDEEYKK